MKNEKLKQGSVDPLGAFSCGFVPWHFFKAVKKPPEAPPGFKVARALWGGLRADVKVKEGGPPRGGGLPPTGENSEPFIPHG